MKRTTGIVMAMALVGLGMTGCGGSNDCEKLGNAICERAADCSGDGSARISDSTGSSSITFDSEGDCKTLYTFGCSDEDIVVDPPTCLSDVEAATCVMTTQGMALAMPETPACEDVPE